MMIGLGLILYMVGVKGWLSLFILIIIAPLVGGYLNMLNGVMGSIHINESSKKLLTLVCVLVLGGLVLELGYVIAFIYFNGGVVGTVVLGVYVFVLIGIGMWVMIIAYVVLGGFISDNYNLLGIGVLPLVVFFVNICGNIVLMWMVMIYAIYNLL